MSIKTKYATDAYIETTEYEELKKGQNKILLKELLEFYDFDVKKISALLKLHQSTIYRRMKKYGIERS
jgi:transcriptional regulator with PAS, ATPase and Fis domain